MMLRTDRYLADLFNYLHSAVPGGLDSVLIVLTGDHGAAPVVELAKENIRLDAGRYDMKKFVGVAQDALAAHFPDKQTSNIVQVSDPYIFLRHELLRERGIDLAEARRVIAERLQNEDGISAAYTRDDIEHQRLPPSRMADAVYNGFNPQRSGDVLVLSKPYWYPTYSGTGTTHGTGFNYDTHVPMVFVGSMIKPGLYTDRSDVRDIAPTLSVLLGINAPACSQGVVLGQMLK
jgi:arylsulfatase A-like enzyme